MKFFITILLLFILIKFNALSKDVDSMLIEAYVCYDKENYSNAIQLFSKLIDDDPSNDFYLLIRGNSYYYLSEFDKSINDYLSIEKIKPGLASIQLAKAYSQKNDVKDAIYYLEKHLQSNYCLSESEIKSDEAFSTLQSAKEWNDLWKDDWYSNTDLLIDEVKYLTKYKRFEDALDIVENRIDNGTRNSEIYAAKGDIYISMNEPELALDAYNRAISISKRETGYFIKRAEIYSQLKDYNKAINDYNYVLEKEPYKVYLLKSVADNYFLLKEYDQAANYMDEYLKYYPEDMYALFDFAKTLYNNQEFLSALKYYNKLIKNNPYKCEYYIGRGLTYLKTNTNNFAENDFSMALDLNPNIGATYVNRGLARYKQGKREEACQDWDRAKKMGEPQGLVYLQEYCK